MAYGYSNYSQGSYGGGSTPTAEGGETFFQRQRRLKGQTAAQTAGTAPPEGSQTPAAAANGGITAPHNTAVFRQPRPQQQGQFATPVTGNGKIPEPVAPAPAVQSVAPAPAPAPAAPPPPQPLSLTELMAKRREAAMAGQGDLAFHQDANGNYIIDTPGAGGAAAGPSGGAVSGSEALFHVTVPKLENLPESYKGTKFTNYVAPEHDATQASELALVNRLLTSGGTMNPAVVEALKQKSMEESLLFQKQQEAAAADDAAGRGFSLSGGMAEAAKRKSAEEMMKSVIGSNRDIDVRAASTNRADDLAALQAAEGVMSGQVGRSGDVYKNILLGQTTQAGDDRSVSQDAIDRAIKGFATNLESSNFDLNQQQANRDDFWKGKQIALQEKGIDGGFASDSARLREQGREFDAGHGLNILQFLEGQRQADNSNGLGWASLNANQQAAMMQQILGLLR